MYVRVDKLFRVLEQSELYSICSKGRINIQDELAEKQMFQGAEWERWADNWEQDEVKQLEGMCWSGQRAADAGAWEGTVWQM